MPSPHSIFPSLHLPVDCGYVAEVSVTIQANERGEMGRKEKKFENILLFAGMLIMYVCLPSIPSLHLQLVLGKTTNCLLKLVQ